MVVLAVAVLVGVVWYLASRTSRSSAGSEPAAVVNSSAAPTMTGVLANSTGPSRSTVPSPSPSPSPSPGASGSPAPSDATPAADPAPSSPAAPSDPAATAATSAPASTTEAPPATPTPPPPSYDADGRLLCADSSITVAASAPAEVRSGSNVIVGMTITNSGTEACRRDVSGTEQVFTVFAADGTRMWSTADCFPGQGSDVRDLTPGQSLQYTVKWSGTSSAPGCTGDRVPLAPGAYTLIAQLGTLSSPPAAFTVS